MVDKTRADYRKLVGKNLEHIEHLKRQIAALTHERDEAARIGGKALAELAEKYSKLNQLKTLALDWYHGEDCDGYGMDEEPEWDECNCGVGDVLRATMPAGIEVYIDRTPERYGLSCILEPPKEKP
jgi:hypothetical protein